MVTTTATTTKSTATVSGSSILTSLGAGSGVDTAALVKSLVSAQFAAKTASLSAQDTALTAQISSVAKVQSAVTSFASALSSLVTGGSLASQPKSSDTSVLTATALSGAKLSGLSTQVTVNKLAAPQTAIARFPGGAPTFAAGGTLTLTFGKAADDAVSSVTPPSDGIKISVPQGATLAQVASALTANGKGLTAAVVTDVDGDAYLSLKGPTGSEQAFTLSGTGSLSQLNVGGTAPAATINSQASNAKVTVDGVSVERASNTISDLVAGVKLTLTGLSPTTSATKTDGTTTTVAKPVSLSSTTPSDGIAQAVNDFVTTYNQVLAELKTETDPATGPLRSDYNATNLMRALRGLTLTTLSSGGAAGDPVNLASIGVSTNKDGTLSVDSTKLTSALQKTPAAVEALFANGTGASGGGLAAALNAITTAAINNKVIVNGRIESTGLAGSTALYTAKLAKVTDAEAQVTADTATYQARLTKQYAASDAIVAAYKASATALQNQITQWNKSTA